MRITTVLNRALTVTVATALVAGTPGIALAAPAKGGRVSRPMRTQAHVAQLPPGVQRPTSEVLLSIGQGELITLPAAASDVWVSNPDAADVYISNPRQIHLFGKAFGETTVFATSAGGGVVYATNVRVSQNLTSIDRMLKAAMPDADIKVTTVGQIAVMTGTVASPDDSAQAQRLVTSLLNPGVSTADPSAALKVAVINRLKLATPLQVMVQVRFSEISKSFAKNIGINLATGDSTGGFKFGVGQGRNFSPQFTPGGPLGVGVTTGSSGTSIINNAAIGSTFGAAGRLFGLDLLGSLDLGERDGQVTTLASPTLSAISGETATFLAGGEIPIPINQGLGAVSVEFKQYGVSLAFTPTVLADGRISLRVRPEVSQLTTQGAVQIGNISIPGISTRRVETTVELGSGESMTIGGLISNTHNNSINKAPGVGDLPVLGALFRSNAFQRDETELVVVVTPYLVKPVNANAIVLPTDGYKAPTDLGRVLLGQLSTGTTGGDRPKPTVAPSATGAPTLGAVAPAPIGAPAQPTQPVPGRAPVATLPAQPQPKKGASVAPGFSF